jgi:hypothetical protein
MGSLREEIDHIMYTGSLRRTSDAGNDDLSALMHRLADTSAPDHGSDDELTFGLSRSFFCPWKHALSE